MLIDTELYIGLGSNLGDREQSLKRAVKRLGELPDTIVVRCSSIYETEPVGYTNQPAFLNMVIAVRTAMELGAFFHAMQQVELELGRERHERWGPRVIDLDFLLAGDRSVKHEELEIPHPRMFERAFVLVPLMEVLNEGNHWFVLAHAAQEKLGSKEGITLWKKTNWLTELEHSEN